MILLSFLLIMSQPLKNLKDQEALNVNFQKRKRSKNQLIKHKISLNRISKKVITGIEKLPTNTGEVEVQEEVAEVDIMTIKEEEDITKAVAEAATTIKIEVVATIRIEETSNNSHTIIRRETSVNFKRTRMKD